MSMMPVMYLLLILTGGNEVCTGRSPFDVDDRIKTKSKYYFFQYMSHFALSL